ncbi:hypothetical protein CMV_005196 [Castanea mollissima]|uniref:Uncharacterized protein n=1 Tax=Castanea mollissima TaxID=60419 RepID=A0A8J4W4G2_9ROSI|nr:hypothetical protein CMV_005196 [Castanea mollissima]
MAMRSFGGQQIDHSFADSFAADATATSGDPFDFSASRFDPKLPRDRSNSRFITEKRIFLFEQLPLFLGASIAEA